jgi:hypothetical protein
MNRDRFLLMVALIAPACTGAFTDGPLQPGSGAAGNGDVVIGGGGAGSGIGAAGTTGTAGVGDGTGVAGAQGTATGGGPGGGAAGTTSACSSEGLPVDVQTGSCAGGPDGGAIGDAGLPMVDPFAAAPICTSNRVWSSGNHGSASMNPGLACISCHARGQGPRYALAGTLYPTAHEPDLCDGVSGGTNGAEVVIVGGNGLSITLTPNAAGNFFFSGNVATPYQAKVVYMGRERAMVEPQTSGDCNNCHTQDGTMPSGTLKAPGRILLP